MIGANLAGILAAAGAGGGPWDISTASYVQDFDVSSQESNPQGLFFSPDGTKMYITGSSGDDINEYNLSSAWNISTASYVRNFSVSAQDGDPEDLFFKPDGTKMYVLGNSGNAINEYSLSSAWNISTASYVRNFSVSSQDGAPTGLFFKPDGTKMYITGASDRVNEYNLSSAWNISTASYVREFDAGSQEGSPQDVFFKPDGTKMYIVGFSGDAVYEYDLSSAWIVSTASYIQSFSVSSQDVSPTGLFFNPEGTKMYVIGYAGDAVYEYDIG